MRQVNRMIQVFIVLLILSVGTYVTFNYAKLKDFTAVISSYYAKEMCTCVFVIEQSEDTCHNIVRQYVPISSVTVDRDNKSVTTTGMFRTNSAKFEGAQYGCTLVGAN